ncbi:Na+/H+ antiporter NhaC family protein [Alicyclobacillus tolerans]|uniref:Na+/H+ antiporter NhaC family protein n=1 Tax=Alicyclobacillus tolerans TaxID=90970 RepID=UPI003B7D3492
MHLYATIFSLIPFLIVIPIALISRQVIPGLIVGLLVGSYMLHPTFVGGLKGAIGTIVQQVVVPNNANLLLFLFGFGSFVGLVRVTGGVQGFANWMGKRIHTARGGYGITWLTAFFTFMAPDFRIVAIAPVMRGVMKKLGVSVMRSAFMIDLTATPFIAVIPIGTVFVGYMIGLLSTSLHHASAGGLRPFQLLLESLPFNFFSWIALLYGLFVSFRKPKPATVDGDTPHNHKPIHRHLRWRLTEQQIQMAHRASRAAHAEVGQVGELGEASQSGKSRAFPDALELASDEIKPDALNLVLPLVLLLALTFFFTWWSGRAQATNIFNAFLHANASLAMLEALVVTLVVSSIYYLIKGLGIDRIMFGFMSGGNEMMSVNVLLIFVWGVSAISSDLGFAQYTQREISHFVPVALLVPALFVIGCVISYFIGSSFGAWAMLMPLGFAIAQHGVGHLPLIAGAVFASGTFGGFASPLSDNTVAMSTVTKLPVMDYANYKTKVAVWLAGISTVLYAAVGWLMPNIA